ncbi:MAG: hypothetical protein R2704_10555 [Microthrixaceae bacterium]
MTSRWADTDAPRGADYDERFDRLAASGRDVTARRRSSPGSSPEPSSMLGAAPVGWPSSYAVGASRPSVSTDESMLSAARERDPDGEWHLGDLSSPALADELGLVGGRPAASTWSGRRNVMIFLAPGTESVTVANLAAHLVPGGALICGFQLQPGGYSAAAFEADCEAAGLEPVERWSTWDRQPFDPSDGYVVAVNRRPR